MLGVIAARLYAQLLFSLSPSFSAVIRPSCSSFSFPINGNGGVRGHEKKRDWLDGNPSVGFDAILGSVRGYRSPKIAFSRFWHVGRYHFLFFCVSSLDINRKVSHELDNNCDCLERFTQSLLRRGQNNNRINCYVTPISK